MNKKLLVSLLLCFFVFSSGLFAEKKEEEAKTVQFLLRKDLVGDPYIFELNDSSEWCSLNSFKSDLIPLGHVPASPKAEAIFFELWLQYWYDFYYLCTNKRTRGGLSLEIINPDVIPAGVRVSCPTTYFILTDIFPEEKDEYGEDRMTFSDKFCLFRDDVWFWYVTYTSTGEPVPNEEAISIINELIRTGFDIQFQVYGEIQGACNMYLHWICMEVTRIQ